MWSVSVAVPASGPVVSGDGPTEPNVCSWPRMAEPQQVPADRSAEPTDRSPQVFDWLPQDIVEEWGLQSFPASDPPANW